MKILSYGVQPVAAIIKSSSNHARKQNARNGFELAKDVAQKSKTASGKDFTSIYKETLQNLWQTPKK